MYYKYSTFHEFIFDLTYRSLDRGWWTLGSRMSNWTTRCSLWGKVVIDFLITFGRGAHRHRITSNGISTIIRLPLPFPLYRYFAHCYFFRSINFFITMGWTWKDKQKDSVALFQTTHAALQNGRETDDRDVLRPKTHSRGVKIDQINLHHSDWFGVTLEETLLRLFNISCV